MNIDNQSIVLSFLSEINESNYESILKYSEDLRNIVNLDLDLLFKKISKLKDILSSIQSVREYMNNDFKDIRRTSHKFLMELLKPDKKKTKDEIFWDKVLNSRDIVDRRYYNRNHYNRTLNEINVLREEISILIEEMRQCELLAELKLIAFNEFIKREIGKKYSDSVKETIYKRSLMEEKNRLEALIQIIKNSIQAGISGYDLSEYESIIADIEEYVKYNQRVKPNTPGLIHPRVEKYTYYHESQRSKDNASFFGYNLNCIVEKSEDISCIDSDGISKVIDGIHNPQYRESEYNSLLRVLALGNIVLDKYDYFRKKGISVLENLSVSSLI